MAAGFVRMNEVYAKNGQPFCQVEKNEHRDLDVAQARAEQHKNQSIMDMHTHFLREGTPITAFVNQRAAVGKAGWNPALAGKEQTMEDLMFPNYVKEIFFEGDTRVSCTSVSDSEYVRFNLTATHQHQHAPDQV